MAKIRDPKTFADYYKVKKTTLRSLGVLNPVLNVDTKLFIDPLLLQRSSHKEISQSDITYKTYFEHVIRLFSASKSYDDPAWKAAKKLLTFPEKEIKGNCLGYGGNSIHGSAFGPQETEALVATAKQIIDLGITDPDLFISLALFEEGIGPDHISDMTTNVIFPDLAKFNEIILKKLNLKGKKFIIKGIECELMPNPFEHPKKYTRNISAIRHFKGSSDCCGLG